MQQETEWDGLDAVMVITRAGLRVRWIEEEDSLWPAGFSPPPGRDPATVAEVVTHLVSEPGIGLAVFDREARIFGVIWSSWQAPWRLRTAPFLRNALWLGAASVVGFHWQPRVSPQPGDQDLDLTRALVELFTGAGLPYTDHLVFGLKGGFRSLRDWPGWTWPEAEQVDLRQVWRRRPRDRKG